MRHFYANALLVAALSSCLFDRPLAQTKKSVLPATVVPTRTARLLTSRLATVARAEESKTKKNANTISARQPLKLKEAAKPVSKVTLTASKGASKGTAVKPATLKNAERVAGKTTQAALTAKAVPLKASAKTLPMAARKTNGKEIKASALAWQQKGKFGRENRTTDEAPTTTRHETVRPINRETTRHVEAPETAARRPRPRVVEEDVQETPVVVRNHEPRNTEQERVADAPKISIASPDRIEVHEPGSPVILQMHQLPTARPSAPYGTVVTRGNAPPSARKDINIAQQRIFEIQYELAKRGFYTTEPNGIYDDVTVAAMWEFQKNYGLPATGYPTAHSLKRLGLTSW